MITLRRRVAPQLVGLLATSLLTVMSGCGYVRVDGETWSYNSFPNGTTKITYTGPLKFPPNHPKYPGIELGPGATITEEVTNYEIRLVDHITQHGIFLYPFTAPSGEAATQRDGGSGQITIDGDVAAGSTYTMTIPALFGNAAAVVPVTGNFTLVGAADAFTPNGAGGWSLRPGGLTSLSYHVSGPGAVWQAPFDTPFGPLEGTGTVRTVGGFLFEYVSNPSAVSASLTNGYVDPNSRAWQYGITASAPARLTLGAYVSLGSATFSGGLDVQ